MLENSICTIAIPPKSRSEKYVHLSYENAGLRTRLVFLDPSGRASQPFLKVSKPQLKRLSCKIPTVMEAQEPAEKEGTGHKQLLAMLRDAGLRSWLYCKHSGQKPQATQNLCLSWSITETRKPNTILIQLKTM